MRNLGKFQTTYSSPKNHKRVLEKRFRPQFPHDEDYEMYVSSLKTPGNELSNFWKVTIILVTPITMSTALPF